MGGSFISYSTAREQLKCLIWVVDPEWHLCSYMDVVFELGAHEASEIWTSLPHSFTKEGLLQL